MIKSKTRDKISLDSSYDNLALECNPAGFLYHSILVSVSLWSMLTNLGRALIEKLKSGNHTPLAKILWGMGRSKKHFSCLAVDRLSRYNHKAKWGAAGWQSLEMFYNYHEKIKPLLSKRTLEKRLTEFWFEKLENRQAVTNRLKIVTRLIAEAINHFAGEEEIRILSVASGSAQAVIQAIKLSRISKIKATLLDLDPDALEQARDAADAAGLTECFQFVQGTTATLKTLGSGFHVIEMVGFLDYRPEDKAITLINRLKSLMVSGGTLITCNIAPNIEKIFLDWVLLWPMIYRKMEQLRAIISSGGFEDENIAILSEPHRIHNIAVARK